MIILRQGLKRTQRWRRLPILKGGEEPRVENIVIKQGSRVRQAQVEAEGIPQRCPSYLR